jgi:hypothetical protein
MENNFWRVGIIKTPRQTAFELDMEEGRSNLELSNKFSRLDLKAKSTQPTLEVEEEMEDHCESTMACEVSKT